MHNFVFFVVVVGGGFCLFVCLFVCFETGFLCVTVLAILELTLAGLELRDPPVSAS